jgi:hypothetical protein
MGYEPYDYTQDPSYKQLPGGAYRYGSRIYRPNDGVFDYINPFNHLSIYRDPRTVTGDQAKRHQQDLLDSSDQLNQKLAELDPSSPQGRIRALTNAQSAAELEQAFKIQQKYMEPYTMTKQEQMDFVNMQDEQKRKHAIDLINRQQGFNKENLGLQFGYNTQLADQAFGHNSKLLGQKHGYDMELGQMQGDYNLVQQNMRNLTDQSLAQVKTFGDSWNNWQQSVYGMANATSPARGLLRAF